MSEHHSGLTVRWSLAGCGPEVEDELARYVAESSHERFEQLEGLRFKTWRLRPGEWFEGCYVFENEAARARFEADFTVGAAESPGSRIVGSAPVQIEPCQVVAVAEGRSGFRSAPTYDR